MDYSFTDEPGHSLLIQTATIAAITGGAANSLLQEKRVVKVYQNIDILRDVTVAVGFYDMLQDAAGVGFLRCHVLGREVGTGATQLASGVCWDGNGNGNGNGNGKWEMGNGGGGGGGQIRYLFCWKGPWLQAGLMGLCCGFGFRDT